MTYLLTQAKGIAKLLNLTFFICLFIIPGYSQDNGLAFNATSSVDKPEFHKVQRGETLYGISRKYELSVNELRELNQLRGDLIFPGQSLLIEKGGSSRSEANARQVAPRSSAPKEVASAKTYNQPTSLDDMFKETVEVNSTPTRVTPFRQLGSRSTAAKKRDIPSAQVERKVYYEVKSGDNIYTIADEYNVLVAEIREWNAVSEVNEGQTIIVQKIYQPIPMEELKGRTTNTYTAPRSVSRSEAPTVSSTQRNSFSKEIAQRNRTVVPETVAPERNSASIRSVAPSKSNSTYKRDSYGSRSTASQRRNTPSHWSSQGYTKLLEEGNRNAETKSRSIENSANRRSTNINSNTNSIDSESGKYGKIDDPVIDTRFYGIHKTLPIGSKFKLGIPNNTGFVEVEVVGRLSPRSRALIGLSPACISILEGAGAKGTATLIYE